MVYRVVFLPSARQDVLDAAAYISEHASPAVADHWYAGFEEAVLSLRTMPARCPLARERSSRHELRQLLYKSHRIVFTIVHDEVVILHVRHAAREHFP